MRISKMFCAAAALLFALGAAPAANAGPVKCTWADNKDANHLAISGVPVALRGIAQSASTTLTYTWSFGDGTAVETGAVGPNPYVLETTHTYTGSVGTRFTATLTVKDGATTLGSDSYNITIAANDRTTKKKIAVEKGLWYLHTQMLRDNGPAEHGGQIRGRIGKLRRDGRLEWDVTLNSMVTGTAMAENGFKATGSADNPYTEDMLRLVNFVTERLAITPITLKGGGDSGLPVLNPENRTAGGVIDGYAVYLKETSDREFEYGTALRFLANAGLTTQKPLAFDNDLNFTGNASLSIGNWTYAQIVQQMIDFFSWVQLYDKGINYDAAPDANGATIARSETVVPANKRGSWPYWGDGWICDTATQPRCLTEPWTLRGGPDDLTGAYGDTSMAYWIITGLKPAQQMGCSWPAYVKTELNSFLLNNQDQVASSPYYGEFHFGEAYGQHLVERAGQGLVLLNWAGIGKSNARVTSAKNYVGKFWSKDNFELYQGWGTNERGFLGCTDRDGNADDCFQHFSVGAYEYSYWLEKLDPVGCCDQYACTEPGCAYTCTQEDATNGWYGCTEAGQCAPGNEYCAVADYTTCVDPKGFYACYTNSEVVVNTDALNIFGFLCVTEGMKANGFTGFPTADPYNTKYVDLLVNNQFENGSWHDKGWVDGSAFGTSWAVMTLSKL